MLWISKTRVDLDDAVWPRKLDDAVWPRTHPNSILRRQSKMFLNALMVLYISVTGGQDVRGRALVLWVSFGSGFCMVLLTADTITVGAVVRVSVLRGIMQSPDPNETHDSSTTSHVLAARDTNVEYHQGIQEHLGEW